MLVSTEGEGTVDSQVDVEVELVGETGEEMLAVGESRVEGMAVEQGGAVRKSSLGAGDRQLGTGKNVGELAGQAVD